MLVLEIFGVVVRAYIIDSSVISGRINVCIPRIYSNSELFGLASISRGVLDNLEGGMVYKCLQK